MSEKPLADALSKPVDIPDLPDQTVTLTGEYQQGGDAGVHLDAEVDFGKPGGWAGGGQVGWWQSAGLAVKGWLQWKGKRQP